MSVLSLGESGWRIGRSIVVGFGVCAVLAIAVSRGDDPPAASDPPTTKAIPGDGARVSSQDVMDMLYANDPAAPLYPNEDGSIPLTRDLLGRLVFGGPPRATTESAPENNEVLEGEGIISAQLSPAQRLELFSRGRTSVQMPGPKAIRFSTGVPRVVVSGPPVKLALLDAQYARGRRVKAEAPDVGGTAGGPVPARGCAYVINCDDDGNCSLSCSGGCGEKGWTCAEVTRPKPGGGTQTSCECVPPRQ